MVNKPRVLLADDHQIVIDGLRGLLNPHYDLCATVTDGLALVEEARRLQPDVIVADISMPHLNGIDAIRKLRAEGLTAKVVFLTMHPDITYLTRALDAGAAAYVLKHSASDELVNAIDTILRGDTYISPRLRSDSVAELLDPNRRHLRSTIELTERQRDVLQLLAGGKSAKEIGAILDISARTVETHKYKMMDSLGLKTTAELIQHAIKHGLAPSE